MPNIKDVLFNGFSKDTIKFLGDLRSNNNKPWFEAHKGEYERSVLEPLQNLVKEVGPFMLTIDPDFETRPRVDKTISRIYRDTRFSHDKSPFKNTMWITFRRPIKDWKNAPAYFLEISPDSYRYGMGFYSATKETMGRLRRIIDEKPKEFLKAVSFYPKQRDFVVEGEKYKRVLNSGISEEMQEWHQRKNLYLVCNRDIDERFFSRELVDDLISGFRLLAPFYHYLWRLKE